MRHLDTLEATASMLGVAYSTSRPGIGIYHKSRIDICNLVRPASHFGRTGKDQAEVAPSTLAKHLMYNHDSFGEIDSMHGGPQY